MLEPISLHWISEALGFWGSEMSDWKLIGCTWWCLVCIQLLHWYVVVVCCCITSSLQTVSCNVFPTLGLSIMGCWATWSPAPRYYGEPYINNCQFFGWISALDQGRMFSERTPLWMKISIWFPVKILPSTHPLAESLLSHPGVIDPAQNGPEVSEVFIRFQDTIVTLCKKMAFVGNSEFQNRCLRRKSVKFGEQQNFYHPQKHHEVNGCYKPFPNDRFVSGFTTWYMINNLDHRFCGNR